MPFIEFVHDFQPTKISSNFKFCWNKFVFNFLSHSYYKDTPTANFVGPTLAQRGSCRLHVGPTWAKKWLVIWDTLPILGSCPVLVYPYGWYISSNSVEDSEANIVSGVGDCLSHALIIRCQPISHSVSYKIYLARIAFDPRSMCNNSSKFYSVW